MNIIKKYWDAVYIYVLLLVPGLCMTMGIFFTSWKVVGLYTKLSWLQLLLFDCTHLIYMAVGLFFIYQNKKNSDYITEHLGYVKGFVMISVFIQYNFILYLFPSEYVWECTFIFFGAIMLLFDSRLMLLNIVLYAVALLIAHIVRAEEFLPLDAFNLMEIIVWRIWMLVLIALCMMVSVYFVEKILIQVRESRAENVELLARQLKYYKDMDLMDTEIRKFRHDITNHFICMEAMLNAGKTEELKQYFQELKEEFSTQKKMYFTGNDIVDAILNHDLSHNCKKEVEVTLSGKLPEVLTVSAIDMCTVFSNLLSNAIKEANKCAEEQEAEVSIHFAGGNSFFSIRIANSMAESNEADKFKKKDRNHGHGSDKIKNVLEKYSGRFEVEQKAHKMSITIYLPI